MKSFIRNNLIALHTYGTNIDSNYDTDTQQAISIWLNYKNTELQNTNYSESNSQYLLILKDLEIETLKEYLSKSFSEFKEDMPFATRKDFFNNNILRDLDLVNPIISLQYRDFPTTLQNFNFDCYIHFLKTDMQFIDVLVPKSKSLQYFQQYLKVVLETFDDFKNNSLLSKPINDINNKKMKWNKKNIDFLELAKAMYEADCVDKDSISQKDFIDAFSNFFSLELNNYHQDLGKIVNRKTDNLKLLPKLTKSMENWIEERKDTKGEA